MGVFLGLFLGALSILQLVERRQSIDLLADARRERAETLERCLELQGESLQRFVDDYTQWDEMVSFVQTGDRAWAKLNLESSLAGFQARALWVLRVDGTLMYEAHAGDWRGVVKPPLGTKELLTWLRRTPRGRVFAESEAGVLELCGAPVQPSADLRRETPPQGWLIAARVWDEARLQSLERVTASHVGLAEAAGAETSPQGKVMWLWHPLPAVDGRAVRWLKLEYTVTAWAQVLSNDEREFWVFAGFGLLVLGLSAGALYFWVLQPLQRIDRSLTHSDVAVLQPLLRPGTSVELARLARLIERAAQQKCELEQEITKRQQTEAELRERESEVQRAYSNLARLGRDLHDDVIQSLYATGMGLAGAAKLCRTHPDAAVARLEQAQQLLGETIHEVRSFLTGMEPEPIPGQSFHQAMEELVARMRASYPCAATIAIAEPPAQKLSLRERAHLLQFAREALSNALRHGQATQVRLELVEGGAGFIFSVADNGQGFDPASVGKSGRGLSNLEEHARSIGGRLTVSSTPGRGTAVILTLSRTPAA